MTQPLVAQCDRCQLVKRIPTGHRLPTGWRNDMYLGFDLCPECSTRVDTERSRAERSRQVQP